MCIFKHIQLVSSSYLIWFLQITFHKSLQTKITLISYVHLFEIMNSQNKNFHSSCILNIVHMRIPNRSVSGIHKKISQLTVKSLHWNFCTLTRYKKFSLNHEKAHVLGALLDAQHCIVYCCLRVTIPMITACVSVCNCMLSHYAP